MRLALISKSRVAGLFVPLGPPPGLILTVGHVGCNRRCANLAVNAFLVPPQLYTIGIDINVKIADMAYYGKSRSRGNLGNHVTCDVLEWDQAVRRVKNSPPPHPARQHERDGTAWFTKLLCS